MILHTRTILRTTTPNLHNTVLLDIMTLTRNNSRHNLARTQPYTSRLTLAGIGLLRLRDPGLDAHALQGGLVSQGGRARSTCALALATPAPDLVVRCADDGGAGEVAFGAWLEG